MVAEIISVGTELLMGNIVNTNAAYLSKQCASLGIACYTQVTIGDNKERLLKALEAAGKRADLILLTGGLGPTKDDLTKEVCADYLGRSLIRDESVMKHIKLYMEKRGIQKIAESNWKQADVIEGAKLLKNANGTAPGELIVCEGMPTLLLLPGPPGEMEPMFETSVLPYLREQNQSILESCMIKICGVGESLAEDMVLDLIENQTNPTIAPYAKTAEVHFRVTASANSIEAAKEKIEPIKQEFLKRFGSNVYTMEENISLESHLISLLKEKNLAIVTAESLTGGLIAASLIDIPGASWVVNESYITYSNEAKMRLLQVKEETLKQFGAVSEQTAHEMALGAYKRADAQVSVAVTGIAGPDGGTKDKPVGLVYIGCCINGEVTVKKYHFMGDRQMVRDNTVKNALILVRNCILSL